MEIPFIYGLKCPLEGVIRYVGLSTRGMKRPRQHWNKCETENSYKSRWIRRLKNAGLMYEIIVLEEVSSPDILGKSEIEWIAFLKAIGAPLTNTAPGGELGLLGVEFSESHRKKIGDAQRGRPKSEEQRRKMSLANTGKKYSDEYKTNMARSCGGGPIEDQFGNKYASQKEAARVLGLGSGNISKVLRGKLKHLRGYKFKFV
jgi:hypothetical protein